MTGNLHGCMVLSCGVSLLKHDDSSNDVHVVRPGGRFYGYVGCTYDKDRGVPCGMCCEVCFAVAAHRGDHNDPLLL